VLLLRPLFPGLHSHEEIVVLFLESLHEHQVKLEQSLRPIRLVNVKAHGFRVEIGLGNLSSFSIVGLVLLKLLHKLEKFRYPRAHAVTS